MDFKTIEEIISHFKLNNKEVEEIKKELRNIRKNIHPDKTQGEFKNNEDKDIFNNIQQALDFLDQQAFTTLPATKNDITALTTVLKEFALTRKETLDSEAISKRDSVLTSKIQESINTFHKLHTTPKITGVIITSVVTALWAFPSIVKTHPLLSVLYDFNKEFTIIWLFCLIITSFFWLKIKKIEKIDKEIKQNFKLESTQNYIFSLFIKWMHATDKGYEFLDEKHVYHFCKDDLIRFLLTRYEILQSYLRNTDNLRYYEIIRKISDFEDDSNKLNYKKKPTLLFNYLPVPGEINMEIAQLICDLIIDRLNAKEVIIKSKEKSLSDYYEYTEDIEQKFKRR